MADDTAPRPPIELTCGAPGPPHTFLWTPRSGVRPKYCPEHRRARTGGVDVLGAAAATARSSTAYQENQKQISEQVRLAARAREVGRVSRLAAALRVFSSPDAAAKFAGIDADGAELEALVAEARRDHLSLISGDMRATASLADAALHMMLLEGLERRAEMPAKDISQFGRFALESRERLRGDGPQTNYVSISLGVVPPPASGRLTPEQRAKVTGQDK